MFFNGDRPLGRGEHIVQSDLAATLAAIRAGGAEAFYKGDTARRIADAVREAGGVMTADDLAAYTPVIRKPVRGTYRGYEVVSMPPPSSGGIHLIQILNTLEGYDLAALGAGSADALHLMAEAMKPAYADRAAWLGDPDRVRVPVAGLASKDYASKLRRRSIRDAPGGRRDRARRSAPFESDQTTHFSVVDGEGNAVANTYTLNFSYGLGLVAAGTGILLNNEMDDFAAKAGATNAYGLVGGRGEQRRARRASALIDDPDLPVPRWAARHGDGQPRRQPHHHDGSPGHPGRRRFRLEHRRGGRRAAHAPSVAAGRASRRNRLLAGYIAPVAR
jgi:gamma-glutamyltranspeptidase/glutathione hydrolase